MKKTKTPTHIAERKIISSVEDEIFFDTKMKILNRIYNAGVKHYHKILSELYETDEYEQAIATWKKDKDRKSVRAVFDLLRACGITEYNIHSYLGAGKQRAYGTGININFVQKAGSSLWKSISKVVFTGKLPHFRKRGHTNSFSGKNNSTGIIYKGGDTVSVMGRTIRLKPIRESDWYLKESLKHRVKYCTIVRKPTKTGYEYYLQIVLEGPAPKKLTKGNGLCGLDEGTSTLTFYSGDDLQFIELCPEIKKYNSAIKAASQRYQRRMRINNPDCYNKDGTLKKGAKIYNRTNGMRKALFELKYAYRRKSEYVKQFHNHLANMLISKADTFIKEPMDFKALAKHAKETSRKDKEEFVRNKKGEKKLIRKYKRKKRFSKSVTDRSPGYLNAVLVHKAEQYGCHMIDVDKIKYRASQFHHDTGEYRKSKLSERTKIIDGHTVQRDLYSSFLLYHIQDLETPDINSCINDFNNFLELQNKIHSNNPNFGL